MTVETLAARLDGHLVECMEGTKAVAEQLRLVRLDVASARQTVEGTGDRQKVFLADYQRVFAGHEAFVKEWASVKRGVIWVLGAVLTGMIALGVGIVTRPPVSASVYSAQDVARDLAAHDATLLKAIREAKP